MKEKVFIVLLTFMSGLGFNGCLQLPPAPEANSAPKIIEAVAPADSAFLDIRDTARLEFRWTAVADTGSYHLQIAGNKEFAAPLAVDQIIAATSLRPASLTTMMYFWHVRAVGNNIWTPTRRVQLVRPRIDVDVKPLDFGSRRVSTSPVSEKTIPIKYSPDPEGTGKLLVDSLVVLAADSSSRLADPSFSLQNEIKNGDASLIFERGSATFQALVRFHPQSTGPKEAVVLIKSNDWSYRRVYVKLIGNGTR